MTLTLHCFGESGHSYKVALMLRLSGTDWQPRFVDFFGGETRGPDFRALNPMGECPVLQDGDKVLTQSGMILLHLAAALMGKPAAVPAFTGAEPFFHAEYGNSGGRVYDSADIYGKTR